MSFAPIFTGFGSGGTPGGGAPAETAVGDVGFTFIKRFSATGARQGTLYYDGYIYTTSNSDTYQHILRKMDLEGNVLMERDFEQEGTSAHTQINGLYINNDVLYVSANNFNGATHTGWVFECDPVTLAVTATHDIVGRFQEAIVFWNSFFWAVNATAHEIQQYGTNWVLVASHALPDTSPANLFWSDVKVIADVFYLNAHEGFSGQGLRDYTWNGSGFDAVGTTLTGPTANTTQGFFVDTVNKLAWWAERTGLHHTVVSTIYSGLTIYIPPMDDGQQGTAHPGFTLEAFNGTAPYSYGLVSGSLPAGMSLNSGTGAVTGTPTGSGTFTVQFYVQDAVGAVRYSISKSFKVFPSSFGTGFTAAIASQPTKLYDLPVIIDLANMPAGFWSGVAADGGNILVFDQDGTTGLPLDVVTINVVAKTGHIVFKADLSDNFTNRFRITLDGSALALPGNALGRFNVWPNYLWLGVYAFTGDLNDRTEYAHHLTTSAGTGPVYATVATGIGGGLNITADSEFNVTGIVNDGLYTKEVIFITTLIAAGKRVTDTGENQYMMTLGSGTGRRGLGEQNATSKWSYLDGSSFEDGTTNSTTGVDTVLMGTNGLGDDSLWINGVAERNNIIAGGPDSALAKLTVGSANSASSNWRGEIGFIAVTKNKRMTTPYADAISDAILNNGSFVTLS